MESAEGNLRYVTRTRYEKRKEHLLLRQWQGVLAQARMEPQCSCQVFYFLSHFTDMEVTDKGILAKLERGNTPEKDAGIDRPVTDKRIIAMVKKRERAPRINRRSSGRARAE